MASSRDHLHRRLRPLWERLEARDLPAAIPIFSTGVGSDGAPLASGAVDPHFQIISAPDGGPSALVLNSLPYGYVANSSTSQWIGPSASPFNIQDSGDYTYQETFDLTGYDPSTVVIQGQIASDDDSKVILNGVDTGVAVMESSGSDVLGDFDTLHPFTLTQGFVFGLNTIDVVVHNNYSATGLRLDLSGTAATSNSEPSPVPSLTSAVQGSDSTSVQGTLAGIPGDSYQVDFYTSPDGPSLGSTTVTAGASGQATIATDLPVALTPGESLYATATGPDAAASASSAPQVVSALADLSVSSASTAAIAGDDFVLTFDLANDGPSPDTNVVFDETLPAGVSVESVSSSTGTTSVADGKLLLELPSLDPGETVGVVAMIRPTTVGTLTASASATGGVLDPNAANDSASASIQVGRGEATTTLPTSPNPATFGGSVTFSATVAPASIADQPTGSVTFSADGATIATVPLAASGGSTGVATLTTSALATGIHQITATYGGDANFTGSESAAIVQVIQPAATAASLAASPTSSVTGGPVTLTATVSGAGDPTGTVTFLDGPTVIGQVPLGADGQAQLMTSSLSVGSHALTATYGGDANFLASGSTAIAQEVQPIQPIQPILPAATATSLAASPTSSLTGGPVTLTATVSGAGDPTGTVTFLDGPTVIGQVPLGADGQAQLMTSSLSVGSHALTATYGGDANFLASVSAAVPQVVNAIPTVVSVQRFGIHSQPTTIVLTFSTPLAPASAQDLANYQILGPRTKPVPLVRAGLSPDGLTVTLQPRRRLNVHRTYYLEVVGRTPGGLTSAAGVPLDGAPNGKPGSDFVAEITIRTLVPPRKHR